MSRLKTGFLYKDDNVTISKSHQSYQISEQCSLLFQTILEHLIKNIEWIKRGEHKWNLWSIASYSGVHDLEKNWPLFAHVFINYEDRFGESMSWGEKTQCQWIGYKIESAMYNIDYVIAIHVILK
jgi:hypothetical protein